MPTSPATFLNFAAANYPLLHSLFDAKDGLSETQLLVLIQHHRDENDSKPASTFETLQKYRVIEPMPEANARYEMTQPLRRFFEYLLNEHRLTTPVVIQTYLDDLERLSTDLESSIRDKNHHAIEPILTEMNSAIETIRQDSQTNRLGIIGEVIRIKSNREQRTIRERFEIINRLWTRYIEPLENLINIRKVMDATLDRVEQLLQRSEQQFERDGVLYWKFQHTLARLVRMRRDIRHDFREAITEIRPLYEKLRRDSDIAKGASRALEWLDKKGVKSLQLETRLSLPTRHRSEGRFSDAALSAFMLSIKGYRATPPPPLTIYQGNLEHSFIDSTELIQRLHTALPIDDLLEWLLVEYTDQSLHEILRHYNAIYQDPTSDFAFADKERDDYQFANFKIMAYPIRLKKYYGRNQT